MQITIVFKCVLSSGALAERFTAEPSDEVVVQGQITVLKCVVQNRVGQVQWLREEFGLGVGPLFDGYPRYRVDEDPANGTLHIRSHLQ